VTEQLLAAALVTGTLYALLAVSLNLIYGTMRLLNVAHGDVAMIGAYVAYWMFTLWGLSPLVSIFVVLAVTGGIGILAYFGLFRSVLRNAKNLDRLEGNSLLVFFGLSIIAENTAQIMFSGTPRGYEYYHDVVHFAGASLTTSHLVALLVSAAAVTAVLVFFKATIWGLAVRALIQNRDASALVGIDMNRVFMLSSGLGFALAGLAGGLASMYESVTPFMGVRYTMAAFVIIILGGLGNLMGSLFGGLILGVLETAGIAITGPNYRAILIYGIFILVLLWRPQGLFGSTIRVR
jgi:branched-chain amino acid transport system permease protein